MSHAGPTSISRTAPPRRCNSRRDAAGLTVEHRGADVRMRVVLAAVGSRGDTVPFGALAVRLQNEGHSVRLVSHAPLIDTLPPEVRTVPAHSDPDDLLSGPAADAVRRGDLRGLNRARGEFAAFLSSFFEPTMDALEGADVLVASTFALAAVDAALLREVPVIRAHMWPENPRLSGPMPLLPFSWLLPRPVRRGTRGAMRRAEQYLGGFDGGWVKGRLRLNAHHPVGLSTNTHGTLHAVSPRLLSPGQVEGCATGWWSGNSGRLSPRVESAVEGLQTWVYVGFGSMPQSRPEQVLDDVAWAARRLGVRAVVQMDGASAVDDGTLLGIDTEPHAPLFDRVALAVHHGGSGTTGAAVRAGISSVVVPHLADQYYWGHRLHAVGAAPPLIPRPLLTRERLARRIEQGLRPSMRRRAAALGARVRVEDGTGRAVDRIADAVGRANNGVLREPRPESDTPW